MVLLATGSSCCSREFILFQWRGDWGAAPLTVYEYACGRLPIQCFCMRWSI